MDTPKNTENVGIGTFVKRQVKGSGKTYSTLTFEEIAKYADIFSFGTNDLTQTTFGISRDDSGKFLND